jgi:hypothetical protein
MLLSRVMASNIIADQFSPSEKVQRNCPQRQTREAKVQGWLALKSLEEVKHPTNFANLQ